MATYSSIVAWKIPQEPVKLQSMPEVTWHACTQTCLYLQKIINCGPLLRGYQYNLDFLFFFFLVAKQTGMFTSGLPKCKVNV